MCDKETKKLLGDMEARLREHVHEEIYKCKGEIEDEIILKYNQAVALVHTPAEETRHNIERLENRWKWAFGFIGGNIVFILVLIYNIGAWKASVEAGFEGINEKISVLIQTQQTNLDNKDAILFDAKFEEIVRRMETCEQKL